MAAGTLGAVPTALFSAVREGDAHAVAAWLDEGGSVDAGCAEFDGATLLMAAAMGGQEAIVRIRERCRVIVSLRRFLTHVQKRV